MSLLWDLHRPKVSVLSVHLKWNKATSTLLKNNLHNRCHSDHTSEVFSGKANDSTRLRYMTPKIRGKSKQLRASKAGVYQVPFCLSSPPQGFLFLKQISLESVWRRGWSGAAPRRMEFLSNHWLIVCSVLSIDSLHTALWAPPFSSSSLERNTADKLKPRCTPPQRRLTTGTHWSSLAAPLIPSASQ